jgi:predicted MFS family arabinose efflux permease
MADQGLDARRSRALADASDSGAREHPAFWSGAFSMTLCVFTLIASEFMPVYVQPFLETVTGAGVRTLSMIVLMLGIAGYAGTVHVDFYKCVLLQLKWRKT